MGGIDKMINGELSNHELARRYDKKQNIIGKLLDFRLLSDDRVVLVEALDKEDTGRLVIPRFITDIEIMEVGIFGNNIEVGPLHLCSYRDIYVDNPKDRWYNANYLCASMDADKLKLEFKYPEYVKSLKCIFKDCTKLKELNISKLATKNVVTMESMFEWCRDLDIIHLNGLDTSKVTDMNYMFNGCSSIKRIDISSLDTSNVIQMEGMFDGCDSLEYIDISRLDTSKVTNMRYMFRMCAKLVGIEINGIDTSKVVTMEGMFDTCRSLEYIDISRLDTSKVTNMRYMFAGCMGLKGVDIRNIDVSKVNDMTGMFINSCEPQNINGRSKLLHTAHRVW